MHSSDDFDAKPSAKMYCHFKSGEVDDCDVAGEMSEMAKKIGRGSRTQLKKFTISRLDSLL